MNNSPWNLLTAIILSVAIIFGWQYFYERPRLAKLQQAQTQYNQQVTKQRQEHQQLQASPVSRGDALITSQRVKINTGRLSGSINLKGLRFDDLTLINYRQTLDPNSPPVELFSPSVTENAYFAEVGWWSKNAKITLPTAETIWQADQEELIAGGSVSLTWVNPENIRFKVKVSLDKNYLFTIVQSVDNQSSTPITLQHYGLINRLMAPSKDNVVNILHQGMIGVVDGQLQEYSYDKIKDEKKQKFQSGYNNWLGITDKYWLAAFVPASSESYDLSYSSNMQGQKDRYQADFVSQPKIIEAGEVDEVTHYLFAGAKKVNLLDQYKEQYDIALFDRAIDFGWFYILTKPIFNALNFFYKYVGNFGISIMIVTIIIKLLLFTLANKSYRSMKKMKNLQPEMERLKNLYGDDKARLNQEVMALYKREKVNPISGCLPLLLQIPVFFSIYKVLYVTIEMRHAPFFGWIHDLSAPDPTSAFNLFGLLPFTPPSMLMIGAWPLIMALTMYLQQRMSPQPADPVQAQVMKLMPLMFLVMFSSFPAGLLIYWSWNNILSIVQQLYINKSDTDGE